MNIELPDNIQEEKGYLGHTFSKLEALCDTQILALRGIELSVRKLALRWRWKRTKTDEFIRDWRTKSGQKADTQTDTSVYENQGVTQYLRTPKRTISGQKADNLSASKEKETLSPNNIIITPIKEKEIKKEKVKKEIDFSIVADNMRPVVDIWLSYKKEKQQSYKPIGFRTFYKRLCELSGNDPNIAMQIVEQSMTNNYSGIFPLKQENYANNRTNSKINGNGLTEAEQRELWLTNRIRAKYAPLLAEQMADTQRPNE